MDKFAQSKRQTGRGILNELREKINMPGSYLEGFFKPELDRVMNALKSLDDKLRSILTGKKIGTAEAPAITQSAKDLLKSARTNFNRREYMTGVADLGMFHKKLFDITQEISKFFVDVNKIHNKFLFEGTDEEKLKRLREHMERKAALDIPEYFIKEAGIMDFFYNIGTKRGRSLMAWEKKYPKQTKELREWGLKLIDEGDTLLNDTLAYMKEMATARAIRRPDDYMEAANKIKASFDKFDSGGKGFKAYYSNVILPFMKLREDISAQDKAKEPSPMPTPTGPAPGQTELGSTPGAPPGGPPGPGGTQLTMPSPPLGGGYITVAPSQFATPSVPAQEPSIPPPPDTLRDVSAPEHEEVPPEKRVRVAHSNFLASLEAMSKEAPNVLASYISKYAKSIQGDDPETAINLFKIAKKIRG